MKRPDDEAVKQVRGSSLLLAGRGISRLLNGVAQILLARYLSKGDYGAFAYSLAIVNFGEIFTTLGLNRVITRFVPVYEERREFGKAVGTLTLVFGTIVSLGLTVVLLVNLFSGSIQELLIRDRTTVALLSILIALTPIESLNHMTDGVLAVLGKPGAIFFRKHVVSPLLRVGVVSLLLWRDASVRTLAFAYVGIGLIGLLMYASMLARAVRAYDFPIAEAWRRIQVPFREISVFALPVLAGGLANVALEASDAFVLGGLIGPEGVAEIRAVQPLARFVQTFYLSFLLLFTTLTARLYARGDREGINDIYWRTATWIALLSFPVFAIVFVFPESVTSELYGPRYADSAPVLATLALGYFVNGSFGLNGQVLTVFRRMGYLLSVSAVTLAVALASMLLLVPEYGALGAAYGKAGALILGNLLMQAGLRSTGVRFFDVRFASFYLAIAGAISALWILRATIDPPLVVSIGAVGAVWVVLVGATRASLQIGSIFPEIKRIPLARHLAADPEEDA